MVWGRWSWNAFILWEKGPVWWCQGTGLSLLLLAFHKAGCRCFPRNPTMASFWYQIFKFCWRIKCFTITLWTVGLWTREMECLLLGVCNFCSPLGQELKIPMVSSLLQMVRNLGQEFSPVVGSQLKILVFFLHELLSELIYNTCN